MRLLIEAAESEEYSEVERALLRRAAAKLRARSMPVIELGQGARLHVGTALRTADVVQSRSALGETVSRGAQ